MNRIKSLFILVYPFLAAAIALAAVMALAAGGPDLAWAGALLSVLPFIGLYVRAAGSRRLARTSHRLPALSALTLTGLGLALYGVLGAGDASPWGLAAATAGTAGFFLFDLWYSSFGQRVSDALRVGAPIPDFEAEDLEGRTVRPADLAGRPAVYLFYRGNWCPFCMAQVREIIGRYRELTDRGVEVALVSPQPPDLTRRVAELFDVPFRFWVDRGLRAARALDIVHQHGVPAGPLARRYGEHTVLPTVVITDPRGRILFTDQTDNYRVRPEPAIFLRVLASHGY